MATIEFYDCITDGKPQTVSAEVNVQLTAADAYRGGGVDGWLQRYTRRADGTMLKIWRMYSRGDNYAVEGSDGIIHILKPDDTVYARIETLEEMDAKYQAQRRSHEVYLQVYAITNGGER